MEKIIAEYAQKMSAQKYKSLLSYLVLLCLCLQCQHFQCVAIFYFSKNPFGSHSWQTAIIALFDYSKQKVLVLTRLLANQIVAVKMDLQHFFCVW